MVSFTNGEYGSAELLPQASKVAFGGVLKAGDRYSLELIVDGDATTLTYLVSSSDVAAKKGGAFVANQLIESLYASPDIGSLISASVVDGGTALVISSQSNTTPFNLNATMS